MKATFEAAKVPLWQLGADNLHNNVRPIHTMAKSGDPALRQPMFDWKATDMYHELCIFLNRTKEHCYGQ